MKRLLLAVAALVALAAPAPASVLVIDFAMTSDYTGTGSDNPARNASHVVEGYLKTVQPPGGYMTIAASASKTEWMRNGYHVTGWNGSTGTALHQFDVVFVVNWKVGIHSGIDSIINGGHIKGADPSAKWASKPMVFVGPVIYGSGKWTNSTACSTGITSNAGVVTRGLFSYAYYSTKGNEVFRGSSAQNIAAGVAGRPGGIWRALVGYGIASSYLTAAGVQLCTDCDAVTRATSSAAESVMVWAKYRSSAETAPLIFVDLGSLYESRLLAIAAAHADSMSGGRVIGRTRKTAIMVASLFRTNAVAPSVNVSNSGIGPFVPASGAVDTLNMQSSADSIAALKVPISFAIQVNKDTLSALAYQGRILKRIGRYAKVTPQDYAGTTTNVSSAWFGTTGFGAQKSGNASRDAIHDVWGISRTRIVGPPAACATIRDTASIECQLRWSFFRADSIAKVYSLGGVDHVIWAPYTDWTPSGITKTAGTLVDSVLYHAWKAGVRGFMSETLDLDGNVDIYKSPAAQPYGYSYSQKAIRFRDPATGLVAGSMPVLVSRGNDAVSSAVPAHDMVAEHALGWVVGGPWYWTYDANISNTPALLYYHDFYMPTQVLTISASTLGGVGDGTQPRRSGYWQIKNLVHFVSMENSWAWPSHKAAMIVYPEELARDQAQ